MSGLDDKVLPTDASLPELRQHPAEQQPAKAYTTFNALNTVSNAEYESTWDRARRQTLRGAKWVIGYDQIEYHRLGVQAVSVDDWVRDIGSHPGQRVSGYRSS